MSSTVHSARLSQVIFCAALAFSRPGRRRTRRPPIHIHEDKEPQILKINGNNGADFDNDLKTPQNKSASFVSRPASD